MTSLGTIVRRSIEEITKYYPAISVDHYVIMPNHIHMLLQIHSDSNGRSMIAPTSTAILANGKKIDYIPVPGNDVPYKARSVGTYFLAVVTAK